MVKHGGCEAGPPWKPTGPNGWQCPPGAPPRGAGVDGVLGRCSNPAGVQRSLLVSQAHPAPGVHTRTHTRIHHTHRLSHTHTHTLTQRNRHIDANTGTHTHTGTQRSHSRRQQEHRRGHFGDSVQTLQGRKVYSTLSLSPSLFINAFGLLED